MAIVDLTSTDLWTTISQILDPDDEHVCVLPMTTFIKPVRSITVLQTETRIRATGTECPPGSKDLELHRTAKPEDLSTTPEPQPVPEPEPAEESPEPPEPVTPLDPLRIIPKSEIDTLVTDWSFFAELKNVYNCDTELLVHYQAKGVLYGNTLTLPVCTRRLDILVQVDMETDAVRHLLSRGKYLINIDHLQGTLFEFRGAHGANIIDVADFSDPEEEIPLIVSNEAINKHVSSWEFRNQLQAAYNTRLLQPSQSPAVLFKYTLTLPMESEGRNAIFAKIDTKTCEVIGHKLGSAPNYANVALQSGTVFDFTDGKNASKETIDVADFGPTLDPLHEPLILTRNETQQRVGGKPGWADLLAKYQREAGSIGLSSGGILYRNRLTFPINWRIEPQPGDTIVQFDDTTGELLASRDASKNGFESIEHVDGTTFKLTGKSGDELIDIADIGA